MGIKFVQFRSHMRQPVEDTPSKNQAILWHRNCSIHFIDMPRTARTLPPSAMIHLIGRGNNKVGLFKNINDYNQFLHTLFRFLKDEPVFVHNYVLMRTHFHVLAWVEETGCLAALMKSIAVSYNHYYQKQHNYRGHLWHSRFRSIVIKGEPHWAACGRYIELNPVRAGVCDGPEEYPWSSYHYYASDKEDPLVKPIKGILGQDCQKSAYNRENYRDFIMAGLELNQRDMKILYSAK
jgi:putative transposase